MDNNMQQGADKGLGFTKLVAVIIGSTLGSGIFTVSGDMAASGAHTGAILIGWAIAGVGMLALMMSYYGLNKYRPDLTNGVYSYASEGFGHFMGFNSAWGYWISALLCNVSYVCLLFGALGYFIPAFGAGNNLLSIVVGSVFVWFMAALVMRGVSSAAFLNVITTVAKVLPLLVFIIAIIVFRAFDPAIFMDNFWGTGEMPLSEQIMSTTSATVWSFIGVEGAVVLSGRAKKSSDVGKASITGFLCLLALYVLIAVLTVGSVPIEELAGYNTPQLAQVLEHAVGPWGAALVNFGVVLSLLGAFLGWTIIAADCPYSAAQQGVFTKFFAKSNKYDAPVSSLIITNGIVQLFLIVMYFNESTYQLFYGISTLMIMLPYLFSGAYYLKFALTDKGELIKTGSDRAKACIFGGLGTIYGFWMLYSSGLDYLLLSTILYAPGLIIYAIGRKEKGEKLFDKTYELVIAIALIALAAYSLVQLVQGNIQL